MKNALNTIIRILSEHYHYLDGCTRYYRCFTPEQKKLLDKEIAEYRGYVRIFKEPLLNLRKKSQ